MTLITDSGKTDAGETYQQFVQSGPVDISGIIYSDTSDNISFYFGRSCLGSLLEAKEALLEIVEWIIQAENGELA